MTLSSKVQPVRLQQRVLTVLVPQITVTRVMAGHFVTSLDMMGVTLALLRLENPQWVQLLDAPAQVSVEGQIIAV